MRFNKILLTNLFVFVTFITSISYTRQEKNSDIEQVFDSFFREMIVLDPEFATQIAIPEELGIKTSNAALTDISQEAINKKYTLYQNYLTLLNSYKPQDLNKSQQLARDILLWHIENTLLGDKFKYHPYLINPIFGVHNNLTTLMTEYHRITCLRDAQDYISRLECYQTKFDQLFELLNIRREKGIIPPIFIIEKMEKILADFIGVPVEENILFTSFRERLIKLDSIPLDSKLNLHQQVKQNIDQYVYPGYKRFIAYLSEVKSVAKAHTGVWNLPDGEAYYQYCLTTHTSSDLSPEEIHKLGREEVERIQEEAKELLISLGFTERRPYGLMMSQYWRVLGMNNSSKYYYPNSNSSRKRVLKDYQDIIENVREHLPLLFSTVPKTPLVVKPVPKFKEISMGAYYEPASLDREREGTFYVNLVNLPLKPGMKSLTYHEAIPGHHFQIVLQQESPENRLFRNLLHFTAYIEGWALYAEKLGMEYGWYTDPQSKLGYLDSELLRAVRLVVDTGLHYKKWDREEAFEYMQENLGWGSFSQIDRYIVWPGQACAYKIGELKILELRKRAKEALGDQFDIKEFHQAVLQHGAVPLEILENLVNEYIKTSSRAE